MTVKRCGTTYHVVKDGENWLITTTMGLMKITFEVPFSLYPDEFAIKDMIKNVSVFKLNR